MVLDSSEISEIGGLESKTFGLLSTDATVNLAEEALSKQVEISTGLYDDVSIMDEMMDRLGFTRYQMEQAEALYKKL